MSSPEVTLSKLQWRHLCAEFTRMDVLIRREVRRWVLAGQDPNDDYRGMYITQDEAQTLLERPFGVSWGQWIELPTDEEAIFHQQHTYAAAQADAAAQGLIAQGKTPRLHQLAANFGLDHMALDILLLCMAPAFDTKYERLYGYLQDNVTKRRPSVRLVLDLLGQPDVAQFELVDNLTQEALLFRHGLLEHIIEPPPANAHWLNQTLHADETVIAWLRGHYEHHGILDDHVALTTPSATETDRVLAGSAIENLTALYNAQDLPLMALHGADQTRQDAAARLLAHQRQQPLLTVDLKPLIGEQNPAQDVVRAALRDAQLTGALAYLRGWDACLDEDKYAPPDVFVAVCHHPGAVVLSSSTEWHPGSAERSRRLLWHAFNTPTYEERQTLWRHYLNGHSDTSINDTLTTGSLNNLASHFALTSTQIRAAVAAALDAQHQTLDPGLRTSDLFAAARAASNPRLSTLARKIEPRFAWDDIVLPDDQKEILRELVATIRQRPKVLEEWGVGAKLAASAGVTVLFAGPPGTGKTMAAEVIAGELGLDLYKIDLSSVVSKYIGETEKNLERIFTEAASSNAILFFDEADAIFGKRAEVKDAHDRYANIEISYLLQRMEAYDGVTILATNLRGNLDEAFTRRLHFAVDFPFPRAKDRLRIWQTLFPPTVPRADDLDLDFFAREFELAGGNIRNIIVSAAYLAADNGQVVTREHLLHGAKRELRKMGRLVGEE
ncbi:MAG: ATP-binding protein [Caldilineaceae bacterium]